MSTLATAEMGPKYYERIGKPAIPSRATLWRAGMLVAAVALGYGMSVMEWPKAFSAGSKEVGVDISPRSGADYSAEKPTVVFYPINGKLMGDPTLRR